MITLRLLFTIPFVVLSDASEQYKASLISVKECKNPLLPYISNKPFIVYLEIYNTSKGETLLRGNVSVKEEIIDGTQLGGFSYGLETSKGVAWAYELKDLECNNIVTKTILNFLGIPYVKKCMIRKGKYVINSVNVDKIDRAIQGSMARKYGVWVAIVYFYNKTHTLTCWEVRLNVQPVKPKKKL